MLTTITNGTNVPTDKQVVAVNDKRIAKVGFLHASTAPSNWTCIHEGGMLHNVTHYITVENLLKTK